jgi:hypothetical protein
MSAAVARSRAFHHAALVVRDWMALVRQNDHGLIAEYYSACQGKAVRLGRHGVQRFQIRDPSAVAYLSSGEFKTWVRLRLQDAVRRINEAENPYRTGNDLYDARQRQQGPGIIIHETWVKHFLQQCHDNLELRKQVQKYFNSKVRTWR